ncbi:hypothetical protein L484_007295 [Morus notabilis]|uniref:Uncharacterized protein n=1 Tax=Morus notabilis TaxID=981085 RepID=W9R880_9ROSA|nr:hypothetical protein L484_007295 [Morus notabilis]
MAKPKTGLQATSKHPHPLPSPPPPETNPTTTKRSSPSSRTNPRRSSTTKREGRLKTSTGGMLIDGKKLLNVDIKVGDQYDREGFGDFKKGFEICRLISREDLGLAEAGNIVLDSVQFFRNILNVLRLQ